MGQNAVTMKGLGIQLSVPVFDTWEMATHGREGCVHGGEEGGGGEGGGIFVKIRRSTFVYTLCQRFPGPFLERAVCALKGTAVT